MEVSTGFFLRDFSAVLSPTAENLDRFPCHLISEQDIYLSGLADKCVVLVFAAAGLSAASAQAIHCPSRARACACACWCRAVSNGIVIPTVRTCCLRLIDCQVPESSRLPYCPGPVAVLPPSAVPGFSSARAWHSNAACYQLASARSVARVQEAIRGPTPWRSSGQSDVARAPRRHSLRNRRRVSPPAQVCGAHGWKRHHSGIRRLLPLLQRGHHRHVGIVCHNRHRRAGLVSAQTGVVVFQRQADLEDSTRERSWQETASGGAKELGVGAERSCGFAAANERGGVEAVFVSSREPAGVPALLPQSGRSTSTSTATRAR